LFLRFIKYGKVSKPAVVKLSAAATKPPFLKRVSILALRVHVVDIAV
jgi:hypothetical protein